jgi:DNA-binding NarL/FixJ family response regulator
MDADIDCCVIDPMLPDGCGVELSKELLILYPNVRCVFVTARPRSTLPAHLEAIELINKASGLLALRIAVASAVSKVSRP